MGQTPGGQVTRRKKCALFFLFAQRIQDPKVKQTENVLQDLEGGILTRLEL
jgi:hypothetical protein